MMTDQPMNMMTDQPMNMMTDQPMNMMTDQPMNMMTTQPMNMMTTQPMNTMSSVQLVPVISGQDLMKITECDALISHATARRTERMKQSEPVSLTTVSSMPTISPELTENFRAGRSSGRNSSRRSSNSSSSPQSPAQIAAQNRTRALQTDSIAKDECAVCIKAAEFDTPIVGCTTRGVVKSPPTGKSSSSSCTIC